MCVNIPNPISALLLDEQALYRGLGPSLIGAVPTAVAYMPTYEAAKSALKGEDSEMRLTCSLVPVLRLSSLSVSTVDFSCSCSCFRASLVHIII